MRLQVKIISKNLTAFLVIVVWLACASAPSLANPLLLTQQGLNGLLWTPANLSPALWLDASNVNSVTLVGSKVSQWRDLSGNGWNVAESTDAKRPTYNLSGWNGMPVVTFGQNLAIDTNFQMTVPIVVVTVASRQPTVIWGDTSLRREFQFLADSRRYFMFDGSVRTYTGSPNVATTNPQIQIVTMDTTTTTLFENSTPYGPVNKSNQGSGGNLIIGNYNSYNAGLTGNLLEMLVFSAITQADRYKVEGYLAWKWGLQSSLPADHPYKTLGPAK